MPVSRTEKRSSALDSHVEPTRLDRDEHAAVLGELDRVRNEIDQDLAQVVAVAVQDIRHFARDIELEHETLLRARRLQHQLDAAQDVAETEIGVEALELAGFDRGDVEHVLDQRQQRARRGLDARPSIRAARH